MNRSNFKCLSTEIIIPHLIIKNLVNSSNGSNFFIISQHHLFRRGRHTFHPILTIFEINAYETRMPCNIAMYVREK